ncbi:MAG: tetratricopeptide repeat protein [Bacteroidota bacterium]|nr:tetratricopeptide repeat protein [Bacteroidota bacterium]
MSIKRLNIIPIFVLLLIATVSNGQDYQKIISKANEAYSQKKYEEAAMLYDSVLTLEQESAGLYYNLGNSHFKNNNLAYSILYYEKALQLDPNNADLINNLEMARSKTLDKIEKVPQLFYIRWWQNFSNSYSANQWGKIAVASFVILLILAGTFLFASKITIRKISFWTGLVALIFTLLSFVIATQNYNKLTKNKTAIIFNPSVTVKSTPDENSVNLFVLHEGTKVFLQDKVGNYHEIKIENGSQGWIKSNSFKAI